MPLRFRLPHPSWNESYASGESLPWDTGIPEPLLVEMNRVTGHWARTCIGSRLRHRDERDFHGTAWFDVLGIDISEVAIEKARAPRRRDGVGFKSRPRNQFPLANIGVFSSVLPRCCHADWAGSAVIWLGLPHSG
jgi:hypothetical protein